MASDHIFLGTSMIENLRKPIVYHICIILLIKLIRVNQLLNGNTYNLSIMVGPTNKLLIKQ